MPQIYLSCTYTARSKQWQRKKSASEVRAGCERGVSRALRGCYEGVYSSRLTCRPAMTSEYSLSCSGIKKRNALEHGTRHTPRTQQPSNTTCQSQNTHAANTQLSRYSMRRYVTTGRKLVLLQMCGLNCSFYNFNLSFSIKQF